MSDKQATGLVSKLADVMNAVGRIPKNGRNDFHHYDYATEADIVEAIRGELANRNILLIPGITGHERASVGEKGEVVTLLTMQFTFRDGDSNEEISRPWMGSGSDKLDKGLYKAMTGGEKYFLLKTFLIPTGDDPENDTETHPQAQENRRAHEARKQQSIPQPPPRPAPPDSERVAAMRGAARGLPVPVISEPQAKRFYAIAKGAGWTDDSLKEWLKDGYGIESSRAIPRSRYDEICKQAEAGPLAAAGRAQ